MAWAKNGTPLTLGSDLDDIDITDLTATTFNTFLLHTLSTAAKDHRLTTDDNGATDYAWRRSANGGTDNTSVSQAYVDINSGNNGAKDCLGIVYGVNIDGEEKLGQPMVHTSWYAGEMGVLDFFFLLYFRERTFPGDKGRLRFDPVVLIDDASYESSMEQWHPDFAVRWSKVLSEFDIGLHFFSGTSRDPIFEFVTLSSGESALRPVYNLMSQVGVDAQWTHEGWLLKLEGLARDGRGQHFQAAVGGFEYTFYGLWESSIDMGLLGEYHFDNRWDSALTPFNHDVFAGTRWTWNDTHDSAVLAGTFWDHVNHSTTLRLEFERRLGERFTVSLETQWMVSADPNDFAYFFRRDGFVELELRTWF